MENELIVFDMQFNDEELEQEFYDFFTRFDLQPLFTNEHRTTPIRVSWAEARAVIGGRYTRDLWNMADILQMGDDNKMYENALFRIIYNANSVQGMMNNIRKINQHVNSEIGIGYLHNTWNIVWYNKELA